MDIHIFERRMRRPGEHRIPNPLRYGRDRDGRRLAADALQTEVRS